MSNIPYTGGPLPPNPGANPYGQGMYNGTGLPPGPYQNYGQPVPQDKGLPPPLQNGPPYGAPPRPQFQPQVGPGGMPPPPSGLPPNSLASPSQGGPQLPAPGTVPTNQFHSMSLNDPNKAGTRLGLMSGTPGPPAAGPMSGPSVRPAHHPPPGWGAAQPPSNMSRPFPPSGSQPSLNSLSGPHPPLGPGGALPPGAVAPQHLPSQPVGSGYPPAPSHPAGSQPPPPTSAAGLPPPGPGSQPYPPVANTAQQQSGFHGQLPPQPASQQFPPPPHPGSQYSQQPQGPPPPGQPQYSAYAGGPPVFPASGGGLVQMPATPAGPGQMPPPTVSPVGGPFPNQAQYSQQAPGYGMGQPPQPAPPPQQKRLDPDQMPSPIQVIEDDKRNRSGVYQTNMKGSAPPLVTTKFITQDQGNANPRFIRSTMYNIPCTADMIKSAHIPFALAISPFAELGHQEQPPPLVDLGELGPVRCKRCKAYMNSFMQFIDGGRRFQCVFCSAATDVPNEYFAHLDHTGRRVDCYNRAELCLGSFEFVATKDYCKNGVPPKEPAFIFMIDVSYNSVKSGLVQLICDKMKEVLAHLPKEAGADQSDIRVGFVTYHKELHFYNVKSTLAQPQMMVVSDLEDVFVPLVDGFLVKLSEAEAVINSLLSQIPQLFADSKETELVLGPVIQAGLDALKSAERAGRLYIFHTGLPTAEAPGKLKNRDDRKLLGTEKEKTILTPQTPFYSKLGTECVAAGCSVDLFLFPNQYIDVATISDVCRITAGNMYKYSFFQADIDGDAFIEDLKTSVSRSQAFDAILRVRTSTGIRPVDFYGNFYMANTTDVEMASIDSDSTVCLEVKHDDKLSEAEGAYVQVAILYTSVSGQRRLRCHNISFNCCSQMADLFRSCELDVLINFFAKQAIRTSLNANPKQVREHITNEVAQILACYRKNCANPSSAGQLVLPECMKLLPLYANCVVKNDSISGGSEITCDNRSYLMHLVDGMSVTMTNVFFYPRLLPIHTLDLDSSEFPVAIRCSLDRLEDAGIYLLENGLCMFLWIGYNVNPDLIQQIFGVPSAAQIDIDKGQLLQLDNPLSRRLCDLIARIREQRSRYLKLTIVRQRDKMQAWFDHFLVEDKGMNPANSSYVDFLCHIHKEIRNILT